MFSQNNYGKFRYARGTNGRLTESRARDHVVHLGLNISSSAYVFGCMVNG